MVGALIVLVLAGLVVPIALILAAIVVDVAFLGWMVLRAVAGRLAPGLAHRLAHLHLSHRHATPV